MEANNHVKYLQLIARCADLPPTPVAIAHPCDVSSLTAALDAARGILIQPILVGPQERIREIAAANNLDISSFEIVDAEHSHDSRPRRWR